MTRGGGENRYGSMEVRGCGGKDIPHLVTLVIPDAACREPEYSKKAIPLQTVKA